MSLKTFWLFPKMSKLNLVFASLVCKLPDANFEQKHPIYIIKEGFSMIFGLTRGNLLPGLEDD